MKMCPLTRSAEQTAGAKCSESCEWWLDEQKACSWRQMGLLADILWKFYSGILVPKPGDIPPVTLTERVDGFDESDEEDEDDGN